jgi:hypothetical protein
MPINSLATIADTLQEYREATAAMNAEAARGDNSEASKSRLYACEQRFEKASEALSIVCGQVRRGQRGVPPGAVLLAEKLAAERDARGYLVSPEDMHQVAHFLAMAVAGNRRNMAV